MLLGRAPPAGDGDVDGPFGPSVDERHWAVAIVSHVIAIRRAVPADAPAVAEVYLASFKATYDFPLVHDDDDVRGWVRNKLIPTMETWVAVDDGVAGVAGDHVVALMVLAPGWIEHLYVAPDRLGGGIGRRLVELAQERQPNGLTLWTFQVNDRARRFYEHNGFTAVEFGDGSTNEERQPDVRYEWSDERRQGATRGSARSSNRASCPGATARRGA